MDRVERSKLAIKAAGGQTQVARACGVKQPTVFGWTKTGLPRTDWTGETNYSAIIAELTGGKCTRDWIINGGEMVAA